MKEAVLASLMADSTLGIVPAIRDTEASLSEGKLRGAAKRFDTAFRLLDQRRSLIWMESHGTTAFTGGWAVVDRMTMLKLAEGRVSEALDYMDRGQVSLAPFGIGSDWAPDSRMPMRSGEVAVEYAMVADTLLVWTIAARDIGLFRTVIDTVQFARTLADLEEKLERRAGEAEVRLALSELYDRLVRPVEARLGRPGTPMTVITDDDLAEVPFPALLDSRRKRYLIEDHQLRFAPSLRGAKPRPAAMPADGVLLVADPAFDWREHPRLERLAYAREEVRSIAGEYPSKLVLEGTVATRPALESALARAGMIHFSGHAVFDETRPERSYLVLAPAPGKAGSGKITAAELAKLDLRHVRLVVLAGCQTAPFTGLSGGFLAAGVGGTVGSTWDVDDRFTAALMTGFHRQYRGSRDGPQALRAAQLALLHSDDPELRTPAAWAGFRYAGR